MSCRYGFSSVIAFAVIVISCGAYADNANNNQQNPVAQPLTGAIMPPQPGQGPRVKTPVVTAPVKPTPTPAPPPSGGNGNNNGGGKSPATGVNVQNHDANDNHDDYRRHDYPVYVPIVVPYDEYYRQAVPAPPPVVQVCAAQNVAVCGITVAVPGGAQVGETLAVNIPDPAFADPAMSEQQSFSATCVDDSAGAPYYAVVNASDLSCNDFPCQDKKMRLCGATVIIPGGAPMGGVLQMKMPLPFAPDPFTVQCIGSDDRPPAYQMLDNSAVSCSLARTR